MLTDLSALEQQIAAGFPLRDLCLTEGNYRGANLSGARFERVHARGAALPGPILTIPTGERLPA